MKAAIFCVIMHLTSQFDNVPSKTKLQSFFAELFLMDEVPMDFSFSMYRFYDNELRCKKTLTQEEWDIISHLVKVTPLIAGKSHFSIGRLMKHLYLYDPDQAMSVLSALLKMNPSVNVKDFHELFTVIKKSHKLLDFAVWLLLNGQGSVSSQNSEIIKQSLDTSINEIRNALVSVYRYQEELLHIPQKPLK